MRPRIGRILLVMGGGLLLAGAALAIVPRFAQLAAPPLVRVASLAAGIVATNAHAEDMQFREVPAESVTRADRRRTTRRAASEAPPAPEAPPAAAVPAVPPAPSGRERPSVVVGKSGDIMRVGSDVTVSEDDVVSGDVLAVGGDLTVKGHVEGNAVSMGGDIYLESTARVDGDVVCVAGELHEEPGAVVGGKRVVGLRGKNVRVRGGTDTDTDTDFDFDLGGRRHRSHDRGDLGGALAWLLVWLLVGWATAKVAPGRTEAALDSFRRRPGTAFMVGWLALVLTVPGLVAVALLTALLCITIIGIPLGIAVLFGYFLFLAVFVVWGGVVGAAMIGEWIARRRGTPAPSLMRAVVTGVLVLSGAMVVAQMMQMVHFVPFFSGLGTFTWVILLIANILIGVAGWGALLHSEFTTGLLARLWQGRRGTPPPPPPAPAPVEPTPEGPGPGGTSVTSVPVPGGVGPTSWPPPAAPPAPQPPAPPPAPSSPASSFMPPSEGNPPGPTGG